MVVKEIGSVDVGWVDGRDHCRIWLRVFVNKVIPFAKIFPKHMTELFATLLFNTIQNDSCLCEYSEMACVVIGECQPPYL